MIRIRAVTMSCLIGAVSLFIGVACDAQDELSPMHMRLRIKLLRRADVLQELRFPEEKGRQLDRAWGLQLGSPAVTHKDYASIILGRLTKYMKVVEEAMSKEQLRRLDELCRQAELISSEKSHTAIIGQAVKLTAEQKKLLAEKEERLGKELHEMMWSFHRKANRELQAFMTPDQQARWRSETGTEFKFQPTWPGMNLIWGLF